MTRYYIRLPIPETARGSDPALSFGAVSAEGFAEELQAALREASLFERWRAMQEDPDAVDPGLGATDPAAQVSGKQSHLAIDLVARTQLSGNILRHRLRLLAGQHWQLRDVTA